MKVKIDSITIDEKKKEISLRVSLRSDQDDILKKELPITMPLNEYSKEKVLIAMRRTGISHHLETKKPAKVEKSLIMKELKDLEHQFDENKIPVEELQATTARGSGHSPEMPTKDNAKVNTTENPGRKKE